MKTWHHSSSTGPFGFKKRRITFRLTCFITLALCLLMAPIVPRGWQKDVDSYQGNENKELHANSADVMGLGVDIKSWNIESALRQAARCHFLVRRRWIHLNSNCLTTLASEVMLIIAPIMASFLLVVLQDTEPSLNWRTSK